MYSFKPSIAKAFLLASNSEPSVIIVFTKQLPDNSCILLTFIKLSAIRESISWTYFVWNPQLTQSFCRSQDGILHNSCILSNCRDDIKVNIIWINVITNLIAIVISIVVTNVSMKWIKISQDGSPGSGSGNSQQDLMVSSLARRYLFS